MDKAELLTDFKKAFDDNVIHVGYDVTKEYKLSKGCIPTSSKTGKQSKKVILIYYQDRPTLVSVP